MEDGGHRYKTLVTPITRNQKTYWKVVVVEKIALYPGRSVNVSQVKIGANSAQDWHASIAHVSKGLKMAQMKISSFQQEETDSDTELYWSDENDNIFWFLSMQCPQFFDWINLQNLCIFLSFFLNLFQTQI